VTPTKPTAPSPLNTAFPNFIPGKHRLPPDFQLWPDAFFPGLKSGTLPTTPPIPPTVATGDVITAVHENTVSTAINDLWINEQWLASNTAVDPTTTTGDMLVRGASSLSRLPVGANGSVIVADSTQALGLRWGTMTDAGGVPSTRRVIAGAGMSGGGPLSAEVTLTANVQTVFGRTGAVVLTTADITAAGGVPATRQVIAGAGMTGGAALTGDVTLNAKVTSVFGRTGDVVLTPGDISAAGGVPSTRQVIAGAGMTGGGALSGDVTLNANVTSVFGRTGAVVLTSADITAAGGLADPTTTKGDMLVRSATALTRLPTVANDGYVLTLDSTQTLGMKWAPASGGSGGGSGTPAGLNGDIQFNNAGAFGASPNLTWNNSTSWLTVMGTSQTTGDILQSGGNVIAQLDSPLYLQTQTANDIIFRPNHVEMMRVTGTGVGIGTNSPAGPLQVVGGAGYQGEVQLVLSNDNSANTYSIGRNSASGHLVFAGYQSSFSGYDFQTTSPSGNIAALTITNNGCVGIGLTNPTVPLTVSSSVNTQVMVQGTTATGYAMLALQSTGREYHLGVGGGSEAGYGVASKFFVFDATGNAMRMVIDTNGAVGIGTTSVVSGNLLEAVGPSGSYIGCTSTQSGSNSWAGFRVRSWIAGATDVWGLLGGSIYGGNTMFAIVNNGAVRLSIDNAGHVGVGTTTNQNPGFPLTVTGPSAAYSTYPQFAVTTGTGLQTDEALYLGVHDGDYSFIQAEKAGTSYRNLLLNPNGGQVGIGSLPVGGNKLTVNGTIYATNGEMVIDAGHGLHVGSIDLGNYAGRGADNNIGCYGGGNLTLNYGAGYGGPVYVGGAVLTSAKGSNFGNPSGPSVNPAVTDSNITLYNYGTTNWAGIGCDSSGNVWMKAGGCPNQQLFLSINNQAVGVGGTNNNPALLTVSSINPVGAMPTNTQLFIAGVSATPSDSTPCGRISLGVDNNMGYGAFIGSMYYGGGLCGVVLGSRSAGTDAGLFIDNRGYVSVGPSSSDRPAGALTVRMNTRGWPAASGATPQYVALRIDDLSNAVLDMGGNAGAGFWLQVTDQTNYGAHYPLVLQPNGGLCAIGSTATPNNAQLCVLNQTTSYTAEFYGNNTNHNLMQQYAPVYHCYFQQGGPNGLTELITYNNGDFNIGFNSGTSEVLYMSRSGAVTRTITVTAGLVGIQRAPSYPLDVNGWIRSASGGFIFPDGTTQSSAASAGVPFSNFRKVGNVIGTVYQNTTGKPLLVKVTINSPLTQNAQVAFFCDGSNPPTTEVTMVAQGNANTWVFQASFIVLPGWYYKATLQAGSGVGVQDWCEWY
jgi:hypothetical protein